MAQAPDLHYSAELLQSIPVGKPVRIKLVAALDVLSTFYPHDTILSPPPEGYVENPAALKLAIRLCHDLFKKDVDMNELRGLIRLAHFVDGRRYDGTNLDADPIWLRYNLAFDHLVPPDDKNPRVLDVVVRRSRDGRIIVLGAADTPLGLLLNESIQRMGGALGQTSADGLYTIFG